MKWDHHKGLYRLESSDRLLSPAAGVFGLTIDGRLTDGLSGEVRADNPQPGELNRDQQLTAAEREEIAQAMIARWLNWLVTDGFPGPCPQEKHVDGIKVPGIDRLLCTCAKADSGDLSPEAARLLEEGLQDAIAGLTSPVPVESTE